MSFLPSFLLRLASSPVSRDAKQLERGGGPSSLGPSSRSKLGDQLVNLVITPIRFVILSEVIIHSAPGINAVLITFSGP